jgi:subtilisin family serine protease
VDWVAGNAARPAVANMSLGGGASSALDTAVANAVAQGITVVVAAGNSNADACNSSPARAPAALTVGATASNDARASYSNYGSCLDVFAPGSAITSTWYTSPTATATLSGTSMASPHVAGLVAQILQNSPAATPADVAGTVKKTATAGKVTSAGTGSPNLLLYTGAPVVTYTAASVGSLTGSALKSGAGWRAAATIAVKGASGVPVPGAVVSGGFTVGGSALSCTTGSNGSCILSSAPLTKTTLQTVFTVTGISGAGLSYDATHNVLTTVVINRP